MNDEHEKKQLEGFNLWMDEVLQELRNKYKHKLELLDDIIAKRNKNPNSKPKTSICSIVREEG